MTLIRHGDVGFERPGLIDAQGHRRDLSRILTDVSAENLDPASLRRLASVPTADLPLIADSIRLGPCVANVGKFICVGLNYLDHVKEAGASVPTEPILFMKATSAITGPDDAPRHDPDRRGEGLLHVQQTSGPGPALRRPVEMIQADEALARGHVIPTALTINRCPIACSD